MKKLPLFTLIALLFSGHAATAADDTLRVGADLSYPPFQYRDSNGTPTGFEIDITNAVCKAIQTKCEYVLTTFDAQIPSLLAKKVDFISPLGVTAKRRQIIDFGDYIYHVPTQLVARKGSNLLPDPAVLKGKHIAVHQGSIQEMYARKYWSSAGVDIVAYPDVDLIYQDLAAGRLDGSLSPSVVMLYGFLNKPEGKDFTLSGPEVHDDTLFSAGSAYGIRKGDKKTQQKLDEGLAKIVADGTWEKIKVHYFGNLEMKANPQANH